MFVRSLTGAVAALLLVCAHATPSPTILERAPAPAAASMACASGYSICNPSGAKSDAQVPGVSAALGQLYTDLVNSLGPDDRVKRSLENMDVIARFLQGRDSPAKPICCAATTKCVLIKSEGLPFCYDKFTTNFFLPDGSYGTVVTGVYKASDGTTLNLLTGDYTFTNSTTGNLYAGNNASAKPNTSSLTLPTQYTGTGVGSAIPATALGGAVLIVTRTALTTATISGSQTVYTTTLTETQSPGGGAAASTTATGTGTGSKNAAMPIVTPGLPNSYAGLLVGVAVGILAL